MNTDAATLDRQIAKLQAELAVLARRKVAILQAEIERLTGGSVSAPASGGDGRKTRQRVTLGWADEMSAGGGVGGSRRGGRPTDRMTGLDDTQIVDRLRRVIEASGDKGISGAKAAEAANVPYQRSLKLLDDNFKRVGTGKGTKFIAKK